MCRKYTFKFICRRAVAANMACFVNCGFALLLPGMNKVYLLLGSNDGDRLLWLQKAIEMLGSGGGTITGRSSVYETAAWGLEQQPAFLNMVVLLETDQTAPELLGSIQHIELLLGRQRDIKWGQRTLDIDILLYNSDIIDIPNLIIPHPYLHERRFTLIPLAELAADYMHPKLHKAISQLLAECPDPLDVHKYAAPQM